MSIDSWTKGKYNGLHLTVHFLRLGLYGEVGDPVMAIQGRNKQIQN